MKVKPDIDDFLSGCIVPKDFSAPPFIVWNFAVSDHPKYDARMTISFEGSFLPRDVFYDGSGNEATIFPIGLN
jgi:hypothetical protein